MRKGWIRHLDFIIIDILSLLCVYLLFWRNTYKLEAGEAFAYREAGVTLLLIHLSVAFLTEAYEFIVRRGLYREFAAAIKQVWIVSLCFIVYVYFSEISKIPLGYILEISVCWLFVMYTLRIIWKKYLRYRYEKVRNTRQIIVATTRKKAEEMLPRLTEEALRGYRITGLAIVDEDMRGQVLKGIPVNAGREDFLDYIGKQVTDEVFLNISDDEEYEWHLINECLLMGVTVHIYMQQQYEKLPNKYAGEVFGYNVLTSSISRITFRQALLKRMMDIVGGLTGMIFTIIAGIIIGPVIYLKSPGPILFSQTRVGKGGRRFKLYKFRSMYMDAEERKKELLALNETNELMFKMKDDPRVIKGIGQFIRKTSIDEMPQFWNVLKGDMSLVGTRPPTEDEYARYKPYHKRRLSIKPGITGMWQISGRSDILDFDEVVRLDSEYIEHYSIEQDLKILVKTVLVVLSGKGTA